MRMRNLNLFLTLAVPAVMMAAEAPSLDSLRHDFDQSFASWRALSVQTGVSPTDELEARIRLMKDLSGWMLAEQANASRSVSTLEKVARDLTLPGTEETALAAARRSAADMLAAVQAKAARLRMLQNVDDLLPDPTAFERLDAEIAAIVERRKKLGQSLNSIEDAVVRIGWHAWLFERQGHSAGVLHEIYQSRLARARQTNNREQDLLRVGAVVREFEGGKLPEWPIMDAGGRPLDRKKLAKAVKRALEERN